MISAFFLVLLVLKPIACFAEVTLNDNEQLLEIIDTQSKLLAQYDTKLKSVEFEFKIIVDNQNKKINELQREVKETKLICEKEMKILSSQHLGSQKDSYFESTRKDTNKINKRLLAPVETTSMTQTRTIAFSAHMSQIEKGLTNHHTLIFDVVQTNIGSGYNKHSGSFVAPETGVYVLTWTLHYYHSGSLCTILAINGVVSGRGYAFSDSGTSHSTSSSITVVHMNKGDTALIRTNDSSCINSGWIMSDFQRWSSFSGWLIF